MAFINFKPTVATYFFRHFTNFIWGTIDSLRRC
uniref:Uncharacterized protein n=1 Tax=Lepeophtheirus salmonis TaxID=72036 RepID=A0A0K2T447_LEPSM